MRVGSPKSKLRAKSECDSSGCRSEDAPGTPLKVMVPLFVALSLAAIPFPLPLATRSALGAEPLRKTADPELRIVAFGDSTTAPRGSLRVYLDQLERMLTADGYNVFTKNAGVGGDTTEAARARFAKDVLAQNPDVVIIQFGINDSAIDVWKSPPATAPRVSIENYQRNLEAFIDALHERSCKVILMTPNPVRWTAALKQRYGRSPYQPDDRDGFNGQLKRYAERVRQIAEQKRVPLVDVYAAFQEFGAQPGRSVDALLLDGMHPNEHGQRLIAESLRPVIEGIIQSGR